MLTDRTDLSILFLSGGMRVVNLQSLLHKLHIFKVQRQVNLKNDQYQDGGKMISNYAETILNSLSAHIAVND